MLRDYQQEMLDRLNEAWRRHRSIMVQMPTGTGKTHLMAEVVREELAVPQTGGEGVLVVAHRRELVAQISQTLTAFGIAHGVIAGGKAADGTQQVQVASIQTLSRHGIGLSPSLVIVDEAHHAPARTYRQMWDRWTQARFLGLTATPCRLGGTAFTDLFDTLLQSWTIREFIDKGWLSDFEYVSAAPDSTAVRRVRLLDKRGADRDYQTKEMATVLDVPGSIAHLHATCQAYARGKKGIVYAIDRNHARHIAEYYGSRGVRCAMIDARTPAAERDRIVEDYRKGGTDVLVNVDVFSEGFDCPEVEFIQLARPTLSISKYLQQVGRGMRVSQGKAHVVILDNVGLYQTFGLPTADRDWQRMFRGRAAGKGLQGVERCVVVDGERQDKELVNLEMVRIKKAGQAGTGLEIFLQDGRYGVMNDGRVTCPARFKRVERLQKGCGFFALGVYVIRNEQGSPQVKEVTTVIDRKGQDLQVKLQGKVYWNQSYFCGIDERGSYSYINCWDPVGNSYYDTYPEFEIVAGVEIGWANEHTRTEMQCRKLRYFTGRVSPRFNEWEMLYNQNIIIARDYLIVKKDANHSYRISGYLGDSVLVECEEQYGYQQIMLDGEKGAFYNSLPKEYTRTFNPSRLGLQRVRTTYPQSRHP